MLMTNWLLVHWKASGKVYYTFPQKPAASVLGEGALAREGGGFPLHHLAALLHLCKVYFTHARSFSTAMHEPQAPQMHPQP